MKKTFPVPGHIKEMFAAAAVAGAMSESYAKVSVDSYAKAWREIDTIHPQVAGHYYSYNGDGVITRHKRPAPRLVQK